MMASCIEGIDINAPINRHSQNRSGWDAWGDELDNGAR